VQFVRGELEAEMAGSGLEGTERVERGKGVSHRTVSLTPMVPILAIDFLALNRRKDALRRGDAAG